MLPFVEITLNSHCPTEPRRYDAEIFEHMVGVIEMLTAKIGRAERVEVRSK